MKDMIVVEPIITIKSALAQAQEDDLNALIQAFIAE